MTAEIKRVATPEDLADFDANYPHNPEGMERMRRMMAEHRAAKRILPDGTLERTRQELEAEIARLWDIIADMQETWVPKEHCNSCAHLNVELRQHRDVRISYLAENERLRNALERMDDRKNPMLPRSEMARIAKEALEYGSRKETTRTT